jgi:hypothetical protein
MTEKYLRHYILNELSLKYDLFSYTDLIKTEFVEYDIYKKSFKFSSRRTTVASFDKKRLEDLLAKKFSCDKSALTVDAEMNGVSSGEWIQDPEPLLNTYADSEFAEFT